LRVKNHITCKNYPMSHEWSTNLQAVVGLTSSNMHSNVARIVS
jgi:hypothetical protein